MVSRSGAGAGRALGGVLRLEGGAGVEASFFSERDPGVLAPLSRTAMAASRASLPEPASGTLPVPDPVRGAGEGGRSERYRPWQVAQWLCAGSLGAKDTLHF